MVSTTPFQSHIRQPSNLFAERANALFAQYRSFAGVVRREYLSIEELIRHGVSLDVIARELSECYGVQGSLSALKSALNRIRRAQEGKIHQDWLNQHAPLQDMPPEARFMGDPYARADAGRSGISPSYPPAYFPGGGQPPLPYGHPQQPGAMPVYAPSISVPRYYPSL
ncbi:MULTISPECIES: hypothetical protein [Cupriavidus]